MTAARVATTIATLVFLGLVITGAYAILTPAASLIGNVSEAGR